MALLCSPLLQRANIAARDIEKCYLEMSFRASKWQIRRGRFAPLFQAIDLHLKLYKE